MKDYIAKRLQRGGTVQPMSMDAWRDQIPVAKQSTIPTKGVLQMSPVMKNLFTGQAVTGATKNDPGAPLYTSAQMAAESNQGTISTPRNYSLREKAIGLLNKVDRAGDNQVAGIVTQPLKAALRALRPDQYFNNVHSDADIMGGLGKFALDASAWLPIADGVKGVAGFVPGGSAEYNSDVLQHMLNQGKDGEWKALEYEYDPRTVGERFVDRAHDLYAGDTRTRNINGMFMPGYPIRPGLTTLLNKSPLLKARTNYLQGEHIMNAPLTMDNIDHFAGNDNLLGLRDGNGLLLKKQAQTEGAARKVDGVLDPKFGDRTLFNTFKERVFGKQTADEPDFHQQMQLRNDSPEPMFTAQLNPNNRNVSNYGFFTQGDPSKTQAFMQTFAKHSPVGFSYDPGSLSGDSFTALTGAGRGEAANHIPDLYSVAFGSPSELNGYGKYSKLSQQMLTGDVEGARQRLALLNRSNLNRLRIPEDTQALLLERAGLEKAPTYIKLPTIKVGPNAGTVWGPEDWANFNAKQKSYIDMHKMHQEYMNRNLNDLHGDYTDLGDHPDAIDDYVLRRRGGVPMTNAKSEEYEDIFNNPSPDGSLRMDSWEMGGEGHNNIGAMAGSGQTRRDATRNFLVNHTPTQNVAFRPFNLSNDDLPFDMRKK